MDKRNRTTDMVKRVLSLAVCIVGLLSMGQSFTFTDQGFMFQCLPVVSGGSACGGLLCENFEDATTGYDNNNANGWTTNYGTAINPKSSTSPDPLEGTQSLNIDGNGGSGSVFAAFTAQSELFVYFEIYRENTSYTGNFDTLGFYNGTTSLVIFTTTSTQFKTTGIFDNTFAANTKTYIWLRMKAGSGANAEVDCYISTTSTKPGSPTSSMAFGSWTSTINRIYLNPDDGFGDVHMHFDKIRISSSDIGSNPP